MTHNLFYSLALTALLQPGIASAPQTHDFSGTWDKDSTRSESAAQAISAAAEAPTRLVIEQSPVQVRIDRQRRDGRRDVVTYLFPDPKMVGAAPENPKGAGGTTVEQARAEWKDGRLLLRTALTVNGMALTTVETFTAMRGGREIHVETQVQMHHGYGGTDPAIKAGSTGRDVYVKTKR